jgi:hypothetical protein
MRLMLRQILTVLYQISHKLDLIIKENDFSTEDALVRAETQNVKDAQGRLPTDTAQPKGK